MPAKNFARLHASKNQNKTSQRLKKLKQEIFRTQMQINRLKTQQAKFSDDERKARTRNLIQLGGLLHVINLPGELGITPYEDLQLDLDAQDKAATLLGFLIEAKIKIFDQELDENVKSRWLETGIQKMKIQAYKNLA